jgi:membrane carboxypeptidase/penicillin-binding protein PbpC
VRDEKGGNVPYQPLNYDRRFHGPVSVRTALANSYNIPAVRALDRIGVETLTAVASAAGITSFTEEYGLALTLGGGEVKLLDLATAFGIFQDGRRLDTRALLDVQERDAAGHWRSLLGRETVEPGIPLPPSSGRGSRVISPQAAYLVTDILSDDLARLPAFGSSSVLELPFSAAVKTGTTTDWRDNWTIGYSTRRIVGVWVGNADNTPMLDVSGIDGAGPIWHDLMLAAHTTPPAAFARPEGIVEVQVCAPSGLLPTRYCGRVHTEKFIAGTEPAAADGQFQPFTVDLATGLLADATTPPERRAERVYWVLPPAYHDWMLAQGVPLPPPAAAAATPGTVSASQAAGPLVLTAPTSNTAYRIHPGVPRERQRIEIAGYVASGERWAELRLMQDGVTLAEANDAGRMSVWWMLTPGAHRFWMEGRRTSTDLSVTSDAALVIVDDFGKAQTVAAQP